MKAFLHRYFIHICIILEICIIITLCVFIIKKYHILAWFMPPPVTPIHKEDLIFPEDAPLKRFYEPKPNTIQKSDPSWLGHTVTYTINDDTLNERYTYAVNKPKNTYRILALGDSFTYGLGVNTSENWTELLEDKLQKSPLCPDNRRYEVINMGVEGYDVQYTTYRYKSRGLKYTPDLIIWFESGAGFTRINEVFSELGERVGHSLNEHFIWNLFKQVYPEEQLYVQIDAAWKDFFEARGDTPVVLATFSFLPSKYIDKLLYWKKHEKNMSLYAGVPNFNDVDGGLPDGHPNVKGHTLISDGIYTYLQNGKIIPCENE